jgi:hypothetical protein
MERIFRRLLWLVAVMTLVLVVFCLCSCAGNPARVSIPKDAPAEAYASPALMTPEQIGANQHAQATMALFSKPLPTR